MNAAFSLAATVILVALALWLLGGVLLRVGGMLFAVGGLLITATTGSPAMAVGSIPGGLVWLAGHWLFALRHHYFRSPLARRVFLETLPGQLDPTRRWGIANVPRGNRR